MLRRWIFCFTLLLPAFVFAQFPNILIGTSNTPNEPCIALDPKQPHRMLAAANINNYYISDDTGYTWTEHQLFSPYGVWGDPVLIADTAGNFYFFHLSNPPSGNWIDRIVCQKTVGADTTWTAGTFFGLNGTKAQDKEWATINRTNNHVYVTWTQFDVYGSALPTDSSVIFFTSSADGGDTWSNPLRINTIAGDCLDDDNTVEGAVPTVGANGEIYVAWAGPQGILFDRSLDGGATWLNDDIPVTTIQGGWNFQIPGISRCNGLPVIACDTSTSAFRGTIYINWSDQRNGTDDTDVWLVKSTDGGNTWSNPARVNDDSSGRQQFFTWMTIDQSNGYLYFVFYDRRNHADNATDVYCAVSKDGGNTFKNIKISESPFVPDNAIFFGDYTNIAAHNGIIRPIWTRLHNGELSIWTAIVSENDSATSANTISVQSPVFELNQNYPNPAGDETFISFKLHQRAKISLAVYNALGEKVITAVDEEWYDYGKHILSLDTKILTESGVFYYELSVDAKVKTRRMLVMQK